MTRAAPAADEARPPPPPAAPKERALFRRLRRLAWSVALLAALWIAFAEATLMRPPRNLPAATPHRLARDSSGTLRYGRSYLRRTGGVWEMGLVGDPVALGDAHARLAREPMVRIESRMMGLFSHYVPSAPLRALIGLIVRGRNRNLDRDFPAPRLQEIAAEARAFAADDPFDDFLPTYHRLVTLHALYDVSLSFENSPLIGCSAAFASGAHTRDGHTYVGRNFDMEVDPVFDEQKSVDLYRPRGAIPFASVAWPGLTGVVTGMNLAGIFVAVHGARAGSASARGVPVPTTVRAVMERARTLEDAVAIVRADAPMVSHMLIVVDGDRGVGAVIERAPGRPPAVRPLGSIGGVSNHYATPALAADPRNEAVRRGTSTIARQSRLDELLAAGDGAFDPALMLALLRDRRGAGGAEIPLGHRGALDAWIATHSVIADATERVLWVSAAPHTLGSYVRFDLRRLLADEYDPGGDVQAEVLPADPMMLDGTYARWDAARRLAAEADLLVGRRDAAGALALADRALAAVPQGDMQALTVRARALTLLGRRADAAAAWAAVLRAQPPSPAEADEARAQLRTLGAGGAQ